MHVPTKRERYFCFSSIRIIEKFTFAIESYETMTILRNPSFKIFQQNDPKLNVIRKQILLPKVIICFPVTRP